MSISEFGNSPMRIVVAMLSLLLAPALLAQEISPADGIILPIKTPVLLEFSNEVSSKNALNGAEVNFILAEDIVVDDVILVAKGAPAVGEVIHAQKSGFGGRGGELIIAARYIRLGEQRIALRSLKPLAGPYAGKNHSAAALAVSMVPYAGLVSLFITGGEIVIPAGTQALALTAAETVMPPTQSLENTAPDVGVVEQ
jgi:hypothetical protein